MQPTYEPRVRALVGREGIVGDDVADADPAARSQDARDLREHGRLVGRRG